MTPLCLIRPQPGCAASLAAARALGLEALAFPLFEVEPVAWQVPDPADYDALLVGSANALRHAGPGLSALNGLPALCVGKATADEARAAGFAVAATGSGGLQVVLEQLDPAHRRLLRLCGAERIVLAVPEGVTIDERVTYAARALPMPAALADALHGPAVVALHSAEAARHLAHEVERLGLNRAAIALAAMGQRVAAAAGPGWAQVAVAASPDDAALLAQARALCQEAR